MTNCLYFPQLKRQSIQNYYSNKGSFYASYNCRSNYEKVSEDCQFRCVYCDVLIDECGGDPFSLDHFRPIHIFGDKFNGILKVHPYNLYLSCQKCNVLKSNDWKGCTETQDGYSFHSRLGYIDRFNDDINLYIKVDNEGRLECVNNSGPGKYMIGKLLLNRTNRVYIRKLRQVKAKAENVQEILIQKQQEFMDEWQAGNFSDEEVRQKMQFFHALHAKLNRLKLIKY